MVGGIIPLCQDGHVLISGTYECFFPCYRKCEDVIKLRTLIRGDYDGLSRWVQCNHRHPYKRPARRSKEEGDVMPEAGGEVMDARLLPEECRQPLEAGQVRKWILLYNLQRELGWLTTSGIFTFQNSNLRTARE